MEALTSKSAADPEGYLSHPVNAYKLVKRLNTEWPALEDLVLQDSAAGEEWRADAWESLGCVWLSLSWVWVRRACAMCEQGPCHLTSFPFSVGTSQWLALLRNTCW